MPQDWIKFLEAHFSKLWLLCLGWVVVAFTAKYFWHRSKGQFCEDPPAGDLIFSESFASGRSLRSWKTRMGGASNCLKVMLTHDRLVIRPVFPFLILGPDIDLVHSIPLSNIESVVPKTGFLKKKICILFRLPSGDLREIEIMARNSNQLENALFAAIPKAK